MVADQAFLGKVNFTMVSQPVISYLSNARVDFNNVWAFVTDSERCMKKAYNTILKGLFSNSKHTTCFARFLNRALDVSPKNSELCAQVKVFCHHPSNTFALEYLSEHLDVIGEFMATLTEGPGVIRIYASF